MASSEWVKKEKVNAEKLKGTIKKQRANGKEGQNE